MCVCRYFALETACRLSVSENRVLATVRETNRKFQGVVTRLCNGELHTLCYGAWPYGGESRRRKCDDNVGGGDIAY